MKATHLITLLVTLGAMLPATASAGTATFVDGTLIYDAAHGEQNDLVAGVTGACAGLATPCLRIADSVAISPPPGCAPEASAIVCPIPQWVVLRLGDGDDTVRDWNGPSLIDGGPGDDLLLGNGGDDRLNGGAGADVLAGGAGNDTLRIRDGAGDAVTCGAGVDDVSADALDVVAPGACELLHKARGRR